MNQNSKYRFIHKGQSLVETAISLLLILFLLAGAVDFGMGFFSFVAIRDAAQEGALYGSVCQNESKLKSRIQTSSTNPVNLALTTITINPKLPPYPNQGETLTITVEYDYPISTPLISTFIGGNTIKISASATSTVIQVDPTCP